MKHTMMLITSSWGKTKTFKLIPVSPECPYNECIYDPVDKVLAIVGKEKKQSLHMLPKLNEFGDISRLKVGRRESNKDFAEERKTLETFYEYYMENRSEIVDLINILAINATNFDYNQYLDGTANPSTEEKPTSRIVTV